jgi:hypothetical protein
MGASARAQSPLPPPQVEVSNGVVQTEIGNATYQGIEDLPSGGVVVVFVVPRGSRPEIGPGCELTTFLPDEPAGYDTFAIECDGVFGFITEGSSKADVVRVETSLSGTTILRGGNDRYTSTNPSGAVSGGDGNDTIRLNLRPAVAPRRAEAVAVLFGGDGNDVITGGTRPCTVNGGNGADRLVGGTKNDNMIGGPGGDLMQGRAGNDQLRGDGGNDRLLGGPGSDVLLGGPGANRVNGGSGNDTCTPAPARGRRRGGRRRARARCEGRPGGSRS